MLGGLRKCEIECTALALGAVDPYFTTIFFDKLFTEDQAESGSFFIGSSTGGIGSGLVEKHL